MAETVLIDEATVTAGSDTDVIAHALTTPPEIDFRVVCDNAYVATFYVADVDFDAVDDAGVAALDGYGGAHAATTGLVYRIDCGSYDYVACVVTNSGVDAATITVAVGEDLVAESPTALFTVAEARAWDKAQLASDTTYPDATIIAAEAEIRERLTEWCDVDFIPTTHTDEYHSGDGSHFLDLDRPRITSVTAASTRSGTTWTALSADELADLYPATETGSMLYREISGWPNGVRNIKITYVAGFTAVPDMVHTAALDMAIEKLCVSNVPHMADGYDAGGTSYSWSRADGYNGNWSSLPSVMAAIRAYDYSIGGAA